MDGRPTAIRRPFAASEPDDFWTDPQLIADFKQTIEHVLNRKNTITGVAYKDDKAIFGWETGNEIDATPEWTREIAAYIKQLDPNHLVVDGRSLHGVAQWQVDEPNTDVRLDPPLSRTRPQRFRRPDQARPTP